LSRFWQAGISLIWLASLFFASVSNSGLVQAAPRQSSFTIALAQAEELMNEMTVAEKIGQLFLIGFEGTDTSETAQITQLIQDYHIGGVMLSADNNNFELSETPIASYANFIETLQRLEYNNAFTLDDNKVAQETGNTYIPLLIGIQQPGDGIGYDQLFTGVTQLPNQIAIGATWNTDYAFLTGQQLGTELSALGFNLIFGPSLDVVVNVEQWHAAQSFGSDPEWVSQMGQEYIRGLHAGSDNQILVIAEHFPGAGNADRPNTEEISTVLQTMDELETNELLPFYAVTGNAPSAEQQADGVLVSHIRYEALQGTIRTTTRPISLDQNALEPLFLEDELQEWKSNGGLLISDDLASLAVRRFFDPTQQSFDARQVVLAALTAGNDLLYINGQVDPTNEASYLNLLDAMKFFSDKYRADPVFAGQVEKAVLKVLTKKFMLYSDFSIDEVVPSPEEQDAIGQDNDFVFNIAQESVTLISPSLDALELVMPNPPGARDRVIFISDISQSRQCDRCELVTDFSATSLMSAVLDLYGPQGSGLVTPSHLTSHSYTELINFLNDTTFELEHPILENLLLADWVVFAQLETDPQKPNSFALKKLLTDNPDLLRGKQVVVFSFNAPAVLDATEISKLTAYYTVYSKGKEFVDVAARVLFEDLPISGALPVSMPAIGYVIEVITSPDPGNVIPLEVDLETLTQMRAETNTDTAATPQPTPQSTPEGVEDEVTPTPIIAMPAAFQVGDSIPLIAGPIYDRNGHLVADGTKVQFQAINFAENANVTQVIDTVTENGMARAVYPIQSSGLMELRVVSSPASLSSVLQIDVPDEGIATVLELNPQPADNDIPTGTPQPTNTITPTPTATIVPTVTPVLEKLSIYNPGAEHWIFAVVIAWSAGAAVFMATKSSHTLRWQARRGLVVVIFSLAAYFYLILSLPGAEWLLLNLKRALATLLVSGIGALLGVLAGWIWHHEFE
jgi:beta-N-acetylhexosaminidase